MANVFVAPRRMESGNSAFNVYIVKNRANQFLGYSELSRTRSNMQWLWGTRHL